MVILLLIAPLTLNLPVLLYIHPTARLYRLIPISHVAPTGPVSGAPPPSHSRSPSVSLARSVPCKTAGTKWRGRSGTMANKRPERKGQRCGSSLSAPSPTPSTAPTFPPHPNHPLLHMSSHLQLMVFLGKTNVTSFMTSNQR